MASPRCPAASGTSDSPARSFAARVSRSRPFCSRDRRLKANVFRESGRRPQYNGAIRFSASARSITFLSTEPFWNSLTASTSWPCARRTRTTAKSQHSSAGKHIGWILWGTDRQDGFVRDGVGRIGQRCPNVDLVSRFDRGLVGKPARPNDFVALKPMSTCGYRCAQCAGPTMGSAPAADAYPAHCIVRGTHLTAWARTYLAVSVWNCKCDEPGPRGLSNGNYRRRMKLVSGP
jgi:hypothetical protein